MQRTILISGASRGIGRAIAEQALADGHKLSLGVRNIESLKGTLLDPEVTGKDKIMLHKYDAKDSFSAKEWVDSTLNYYGNFDSIIYSSGIFYNTPLIFEDEQKQEIDELWRVNVMGPWYAVRACWDELISNEASRIIVLVSMSGKRSKGKLAGYCTSKFALMGLCQTIKNESWQYGLRITAICPGWVNTDMAKNVSAVKKSEMTQPSDIARLCSELLQLPNSCIPFELSMSCLKE